jgi:chloride channel 3/4/5
MPQDAEATEDAHERTALLGRRVASLRGDEAHSIVSSAVSKDEQALGSTAIGERLPYNDYTTIDWLHDLVSAETCGMRQHD